MVERPTRAETRALIGPSDDATLSAIMGLGLTRAELSEARAWFENDEAMLNEGRRVPTGRVAEVIALLQEKGGQQDEGGARRRRPGRPLDGLRGSACRTAVSAVRAYACCRLFSTVSGLAAAPIFRPNEWLTIAEIPL